MIQQPLELLPAQCALCLVDDAEPIAVGEDFEYRTAADSFLMMRCRRCGLVFLNPRPEDGEGPRIYPDHYHAFNFSEDGFGIIHRARRRLEARRLLHWCRGLPADARILDVGCGDGFHLELLREFGPPSWDLQGVGIGYSQEVRESPHVHFVYPVGGIGAACEVLADEVRDAIHTESPVESIEVRDNRVVGVTVHGEHLAASAVISTAPLPILAKLVRGTDRLSELAQFSYRPMVFVNMKFDGAQVMRDVVTWTPEDRYPFFRTSDIGRALPWLVPEGKSLLTCDIGCQVGDEIWTSSADALAQSCLAGLDDIVPGLSRRFQGVRIVRTPFAYPIFSQQYEEKRQQLDTGTGVDGLSSVGRNGEFKHILMEDVYWRTRKKCCEVLAYLESDKARIADQSSSTAGLI